MKRVLWVTTLGFCLHLQAGCSMPSSVRSLVSGPERKDDPLASLTGDVSPSYKSAKKELKTADKTVLKFARWREELGDHAEAKDQYLTILSDNPDCVEARLGVARVEFATGRVTEAVNILKATTRKYPDRADAWMELGRIQSDRQEWGQAVQSLSRAVDIDSDNQSARYQLGIALARSERFEEARSHLTFAVGESAAMYNIGFVLYQSDRRDEAAHWFHRALNSHPDQRTRALSSQMLAQLSNGPSEKPGQPREPSRVDVALTSYQAYRDTPGQPRQDIESVAPPAYAAGPSPAGPSPAGPSPAAGPPPAGQRPPTGVAFTNDAAYASANNQPGVAARGGAAIQFQPQPRAAQNYPPARTHNAPTPGMAAVSYQNYGQAPTTQQPVPQWTGPGNSQPAYTPSTRQAVEPQPWRGPMQ
ncbi:MAG: tetratricopeptide repeat protein [Fuerstiella sp.]